MTYVDFRIFAALLASAVLGCSSPQLSPPAVSRHDEALEQGAAMQVVAHEDDDILFMSPDLLRDIRTGRQVFTLFVTGGDAGLGPDYWLSREHGARAAYASMAGVADAWTANSMRVAGYTVPVFSLSTRPNIRLAFLRLPDGCGGEGCAAAGQSIEFLWRNEAEVMTLDQSATYSRASLIEVLAQLMNEVAPRVLRIQNNLDAAGDHIDHHTAALFAYEAQQQLVSSATVTAYMGYPISGSAANVSGEELAAKQQAFWTYAQFDARVCNDADCSLGILSDYEDWLARQYVAVAPEGSAIRLQGRDKCLDVRGSDDANGTVVQLWDCVDVPNQLFHLTLNGELRGYADKCVDVRGPSSSNGTAVQIWDCVGVSNQHWRLDSLGRIVGYANKCLQVRRAAGDPVEYANGTPLEMWDCQDVPAQRWSL